MHLTNLHHTLAIKANNGKLERPKWSQSISYKLDKKGKESDETLFILENI